MEKKTIGQFIAALRKANGMTQKELAARLFVSDKEVSRWERNESAPDLSLIPAIAEIFGVTSDEILRGERRNLQNENADASSEKGKKQITVLLNRSKIKFQVYSMISMGIAGIGLLGTMIGNFVLLNARVGFFIGSIFYLVAMICECAFFITILSAIDLEEIDRTELDEARNNIIKWFTNTGIMIICAFVFCLPLLILVTDGYWGLTAGAWFQEGGLAAAILFVLCMIISRIIFFASKKINLFQWWEEKSQKYQLQLIYVRKVGIAVLFTFILQGVFNYISDPPMFVSGTVFENYEDFQAYMEKGILGRKPLRNIFTMITVTLR